MACVHAAGCAPVSFDMTVPDSKLEESRQEHGHVIMIFNQLCVLRCKLRCLKPLAVCYLLASFARSIFAPVFFNGQENGHRNGSWGGINVI